MSPQNNSDLLPLYPFLSPVAWGLRRGDDLKPGQPYTPAAYRLFNSSSFNKLGIRGDLWMRLRLMENIQLALYLKLTEICTLFKTDDDLSSARASSPPSSTPFLLPGQSARKLSTQVGTTAAAARPSEQYTAMQEAVPQIHILHHIKRTKKKEKGKRRRLQLGPLMFHETSHIILTTDRIKKI